MQYAADPKLPRLGICNLCSSEWDVVPGATSSVSIEEHKLCFWCFISYWSKLSFELVYKPFTFLHC